MPVGVILLVNGAREDDSGFLIGGSILIAGYVFGCAVGALYIAKRGMHRILPA